MMRSLRTVATKGPDDAGPFFCPSTMLASEFMAGESLGSGGAPVDRGTPPGRHHPGTTKPGEWRVHMVSIWWLLVAFIAGGTLGILLMALLQFSGGLPESTSAQLPQAQVSDLNMLPW